MTRDAPAFDFFPERWLVGVAGFSDAEQLAYLRLLCHQWILEDAGLPADMAALKRLAGKGVTEALLAKFPPGADGRRRNARLEAIRTGQRERIAKRREGAARTNAKRWGNHGAGGALSDRSATRGRSRSDSAGESPPPTNHPHEELAVRAGGEGDAGGKSCPTLDEVKAYAPTVMAGEDCAERFWNDCEGSGWVNRHGQPIADWKPLFRNFATIWKSNLNRRAGPPQRPAPAPARSDTANAPGRYG